MKKRTRKNPARKTTKPAAKKRASTTEGAPKDAGAKRSRTPKAPRERDPRLPAIGATIERVYKGRTLSVLCTADGFEFRGKPYTSLSAVAKDAFGQKSINGFLAFGLIPRSTASAKPAAKGRKAKAEKSAADATAPEAK